MGNTRPSGVLPILSKLLFFILCTELTCSPTSVRHNNAHPDMAQ